MENKELLEKVRAKAQVWLGEGFDEDTRKEVQAMLEDPDTTALVDAFYKDLEFGTGGLRGIMGAGTNRMNRYTVSMATQGLSNYLQKAFSHLEQIKVVVGHDCRNNSDFFTNVTAETFSANGIKVYLFDALRPTPEISFAIRKLGCQSGVMITASHNPKEYNGYKAYWDDGAQLLSPHDTNTIDEVSKITTPEMVRQSARPELIEEIGAEIDREFLSAVKKLSLSPEAVRKHADLPIVYTPIHGTGVRMVPRALQEFGFQNIIHVLEQDVVSGDFPTVVSPNPEEPAALNLAIKRADETGADLVMASDPDGDRLGVAIRGRDGLMQLINGNQICMLLTYYSIMRRKELGQLQPNDYCVKTIVTTELIRYIADKQGVTLFDSYTGFKWIAALIRENEGAMRYIGGGEESYGYLWEDFIRDKSCVSACCMFAEMTAWALEKGLSIFDLLDEIYVEYGVFSDRGLNLVRKGRTGSEEILAMMKNYRERPAAELAGSPIVEVRDYLTLEGRNLLTGDTFKINMPATSNVLQYIAEDGSKLSIRPSGTEPKIKYYIGIREEVLGKESLFEAKSKAERRIETIITELGLNK